MASTSRKRDKEKDISYLSKKYCISDNSNTIIIPNEELRESEELQ